MTRTRILTSFYLAATILPIAAAAIPNHVPLAGEWRFQLDSGQVGISETWYARSLTDAIRLPGTTDENRKGALTDYRPIDRLARVWDWKGAAWYQRDITIHTCRLPQIHRRSPRARDRPRNRNHKLGLIFETKVGTGSLLVCAIDLPALQDRHPEARQLLHSLLLYAGSDEFKPSAELDVELFGK